MRIVQSYKKVQVIHSVASCEGGAQTEAPNGAARHGLGGYKLHKMSLIPSPTMKQTGQKSGAN